MNRDDDYEPDDYEDRDRDDYDAPEFRCPECERLGTSYRVCVECLARERVAPEAYA